jgi:hypothetical protein
MMTRAPTRVHLLLGIPLPLLSLSLLLLRSRYLAAQVS